MFDLNVNADVTCDKALAYKTGSADGQEAGKQFAIHGTFVVFTTVCERQLTL